MKNVKNFAVMILFEHQITSNTCSVQWNEDKNTNKLTSAQYAIKLAWVNNPAE